jgi:hypothetical protein
MDGSKLNFELVSVDQVTAQIARGEISEVTTSASQSLNAWEDEGNGNLAYNDLQYPQWQEPFRKAMLELDREKIKERGEIARLAVVDRIKSLAQEPRTSVEQIALADALASLRVLMREVL